MVYSVRADAFSSVRTYRIDVDGLVITEAVDRTERIRWEEIAVVDLMYAPNRFAPNRHVCRLIRHNGCGLDIPSCSYEGLATFRDQANAFTDFVHALHETLADKNHPVTFGRAEAGWRQPLRWTVVSVLLVGLAGWVATLALSGVDRWLTAAKLLLLIALTPVLLRWVKRSQGGTYDPRAIPSRRLPEPGSLTIEEGAR